MNSFTALNAESARHNATAHDWHETDKAKALIARHVQLDELYQANGLWLPTGIEDAFGAAMADIECNLDNLRSDRIRDEIGTLSERDQDDLDLTDAIEESAPQVDAVLEAARKEARNADILALAPVTRVSALAVAA